MYKVLKNSWALFAGFAILATAHGFQGNLLGVRSVIEEFNYLATGSLMSEVVKDIQKVLKLKSQDHTKVTRMLGKACSDPGNFKSSVHCIITSSNYEPAIIKTIKAGGCNCSRAGFIGSYFSALKDRNIPLNWIKKTIPAKKILEYI